MTVVHVRIVSIFLVAIYALCCLTVTTQAQSGGGTEIVYVDISNDIPFNQQDGESWGTAFRFLQDGLDRAQQIIDDPLEADTVEIWVAQGTYRPDQGNNLPQVNDVREHTFRLRSNVAIYGGFTGTEGPLEFHLRDWEQNPTILSGDLDEDDEHACARLWDTARKRTATLSAGPGIDATTTIDGFIIESPHGYAFTADDARPRVFNCTFVSGSTRAAVHLRGESEVVFAHCRFTSPISNPILVGDRSRVYCIE